MVRALGPRATVTVQAMKSQIGSGALPIDVLPSCGFAIHARGGVSLGKIEGAFRALPIPVIGYTREGAFHLDLRCLENEQVFVDQLPALSIAR